MIAEARDALNNGPLSQPVPLQTCNALHRQLVSLLRFPKASPPISSRARFSTSRQLTGHGSYHLAGLGDYNGDGRNDLLWQHPVNGDVWIWYLTDGAFSGHAPVSGPMAYKVLGMK